MPASRRTLLKTLAAVGISTPVFARALRAVAADEPSVTAEMIRQAEWISGVALTDDERQLMLAGVAELVAAYRKLRDVPLDNAVPTAFVFAPLVPPAPRAEDSRPSVLPGPPAKDPPGAPEDLAFSSATALAGWLRTGRLSARDLAELSLARLERYDPALRCVIETTRDQALAQADGADAALREAREGGAPVETGRFTRSRAGEATAAARAAMAASGIAGLPWGAKDLLAVPGTRTTWGAKPYEIQVRPEKAAVAERLEAAGGVLTAKLAVGALAWGDVWFGGTTRNPWNVGQGSSGSSAGPAAATAAGLVSFAIGTETWGSIVSPSTRCGVTGLRPTFGRVSRHGCMALSWTMDKIGPIARSAEDCARVFAAIVGADPRDRAARDVPFRVPEPDDARDLRVGVVLDLFAEEPEPDPTSDAAADELARKRAREWKEIDRRTLDEVAKLDVDLVEIRLPDDLPVDELSFVLTAEAATAFDDLTRSGRDEEMVRQVEQAWPNVFRQGQTIPAVEYLRANRIRHLLQERMEELFADIDAFVAPTFGGSHLLLTNLTGHPSVTMPNGFRSDGTPTSITFTGKLDGEEALLAIARAWQESTEYHLRRPPLEKLEAPGE